jgi:23S rRNA (adenine1618-N6)-methyltransferase
MNHHFHPRNRHQGHYDFAKLCIADQDQAELSLEHFLSITPGHQTSIDFSNVLAVKALNRAILKESYGVKAWDIPADYLCPPIPGRADYIHCLADLLSTTNKNKLPKNKLIKALDIGTGANGVYPLIGVSEYAWHFVACDINPSALENVQRILNANPKHAEKIELRLQSHPQAIFKNIIKEDDWFDITLCNPPFHTSQAEAKAGTERKWANLGKSGDKLNFGGQAAELWCPGGELHFIQRMIQESTQIAKRCLWFTSLVSKSEHLAALNTSLKKAKVMDQRIITMQQGQKQSRLLAWTFLDSNQQAAWAKLRF